MCAPSFAKEKHHKGFKNKSQAATSLIVYKHLILIEQAKAEVCEMRCSNTSGLLGKVCGMEGCEVEEVDCSEAQPVWEGATLNAKPPKSSTRKS